MSFEEAQAKEGWPSDGELVQLFEGLRRDGYRLVPQQLAASLAVLRRARDGGAVRRDLLAYAITPIFAKSPVDQEDVYRRLTRLGLRVQRLAEDPVPKRDPSEEPRAIGGRIWPVAAVAVLAVAAACLLIYWYWLSVYSAPPPASGADPDARSNGPPPVTVIETVVDPIYYVLQSALALLPLAGFASWWLLRRRWRSLARGREVSEAYLDRLDLGRRALGAAPFRGPEMASLSRHWRRFRRVPTRLLDEERTIAATIERGGMFTPVYRTKKLSPQYSILIEERSRHDHIARLVDNLLDRLAEEGVSLDRYYYREGLERLRGEGERSARYTEIDRVASSDRSTLVIVGSGASLFEPMSKRIKARLLSELGRWDHRALLSTLAIEEWSERELALLDGGFALGTARERGFRALGQHAERGFPKHEKLLEAALTSRGGEAPSRAAAVGSAALPRLMDALRERVEAVRRAKAGDEGVESELSRIMALIDGGDGEGAVEAIVGGEQGGRFRLDAPRLMAALRAALSLGSGPSSEAPAAEPETVAAQPPEAADPEPADRPSEAAEWTRQRLVSEMFVREADEIGKFLFDATESNFPHIMVITGPPGSGKSSVLAMVDDMSRRLDLPTGGPTEFVQLSMYEATGGPFSLYRAIADRLGLHLPPEAFGDAKRFLAHLWQERIAKEGFVILALDKADSEITASSEALFDLARAFAEWPQPGLALVVAGNNEPWPADMLPGVTYLRLSTETLADRLRRLVHIHGGAGLAERVPADARLDEIVSLLRELDSPAGEASKPSPRHGP